MIDLKWYLGEQEPDQKQKAQGIDLDWYLNDQQQPQVPPTPQPQVQEPFQRAPGIDDMLAKMTLDERQQYFLGPDKYAQMKAQGERYQQEADRSVLGMTGEMIYKPALAAISRIGTDLAKTAVAGSGIGTRESSLMGIQPEQTQAANVARQQALGDIKQAEQDVAKWADAAGAHPISRAVTEGAVQMGTMLMPQVKFVGTVAKMLPKASQIVQRALGTGIFNALTSLPSIDRGDDGIDGKDLLNYLVGTASAAFGGGMSGKTLKGISAATGAAEKMRAVLTGAATEAIGDTLSAGVEVGTRLGTEGEIKSLSDIMKILKQPDFYASVLLPLATSAVMDLPEYQSIKKGIAAKQPTQYNEFDQQAAVRAADEQGLVEAPDQKYSPMQRQDLNVVPRADGLGKVDEVELPPAEVKANEKLIAQEALSGPTEQPNMKEFKDLKGVGYKKTTEGNLDVEKFDVSNDIDMTITKHILPDGGVSVLKTIVNKSTPGKTGVTRHYYDEMINNVVLAKDGPAGEMLSDPTGLDPAIQITYLDLAQKYKDQGVKLWRSIKDPEDTASPYQFRLATEEAMHAFGNESLKQNYEQIDPRRALLDIGRAWTEESATTGKSYELPGAKPELLTDRAFAEARPKSFRPTTLLSSNQPGRFEDVLESYKNPKFTAKPLAETPTSEEFNMKRVYEPGVKLSQTERVPQPQQEVEQPVVTKPMPQPEPIVTKSVLADNQSPSPAKVELPPKPEEPAEPHAPEKKTFTSIVRERADAKGGFYDQGKQTEAITAQRTAALEDRQLPLSEAAQAVYKAKRSSEIASDALDQYGSNAEAAKAILDDDYTKASSEEKNAVAAAAQHLVIRNSMSDQKLDDASVERLRELANKIPKEGAAALNARQYSLQADERVILAYEEAKAENKDVQEQKKVEGDRIANAAKKAVEDELKKFEDMPIEDKVGKTKQDLSDYTIKKFFKMIGASDGVSENRSGIIANRKTPIMDIVRQHYINDYNVGITLKDRLTKWGMSSSEAERISPLIEQKFGSAAAEGARAWVDAFSKGNQKEISVINDALRRGIFSNELVADALMEKLGMPKFDAAARAEYVKLQGIAEIYEGTDVGNEYLMRAADMLKKYTPNAKQGTKFLEMFYSSKFMPGTLVKTITGAYETLFGDVALGGSVWNRAMDKYLGRKTGKEFSTLNPLTSLLRAGDYVKAARAAIGQNMRGFEGVSNKTVLDVVRTLGDPEKLDKMTGVKGTISKLGGTKALDDQSARELDQWINENENSKDLKTKSAVLWAKQFRLYKLFVSLNDTAGGKIAYENALARQLQAYTQRLSRNLMVPKGEEMQFGGAVDMAKMLYQNPEKLAVELEKYLGSKEATDKVMQDLPEMINNAIQEAKLMTFQMPTKLGEAAGKFKNALNALNTQAISKKLPKVGVGDIVVPFIQFAGKFTSRILDYSPVGLLNALRNTSIFLRDPDNYTGTKKEKLIEKQAGLTQRKVSRQFAEGVVGMELATLGLFQSMLDTWVENNISEEERKVMEKQGYRRGTLNINGNIRAGGAIVDHIWKMATGQLDEKENLMESMMKAAAWKPGDVGFNSNYVPITNVYLGIADSMQKGSTKLTMKDGTIPFLKNLAANVAFSPIDAMTEVMDMGAMKFTSELMRTVKSVTAQDKKYDEAMKELAEFGLKTVVDAGQTVVIPATWSAAARSLDGYRKDIVGDPLVKLGKRFVSRIPFASEFVENKLGLRGEPLEYYKRDAMAIPRALGMFLLGDLITGERSDDKLAFTLAKLHSIANDSDDKTKRAMRTGMDYTEKFQADTKQKMPKSMGGYEYELTPAMAREINSTYLKETGEELDRLIESQAFKRLSGDNQAREMQRIIKRNQEKTYRTIHTKYGKQFYEDYAKKRLEVEREKKPIPGVVLDN